MDGLFAAFMNEVNTQKTDKKKKVEEKLGTAEEVVERLMRRQNSAAAFEHLMISPDASEGEITKQYRKLSILIHPDKCKHESASEAFQILAKAYQEMKDPMYKDKHSDVISEARSRVR